MEQKGHPTVAVAHATFSVAIATTDVVKNGTPGRLENSALNGFSIVISKETTSATKNWAQSSAAMSAISRRDATISVTISESAGTNRPQFRLSLKATPKVVYAACFPGKIQNSEE
jgi:hypothetical protein